jgi:hypothetical protein
VKGFELFFGCDGETLLDLVNACREKPCEVLRLRGLPWLFLVGLGLLFFLGLPVVG